MLLFTLPNTVHAYSYLAIKDQIQGNLHYGIHHNLIKVLVYA